MFPEAFAVEREPRAGRLTPVDRVDDTDAPWSDRARRYLTAYARENLKFATLDAVYWAHNDASPPLPLPPGGDLRAWGGVASSAARVGTIVHAGFSATARDHHPEAEKRVGKKANAGRPVNLWRSNICGGSFSPIVQAPTPERVMHMATRNGGVACGAHRTKRAAAHNDHLVADTKAGVTCHRCRGTRAYGRAK
jgi:hypothetical protein